MHAVLLILRVKCWGIMREFCGPVGYCWPKVSQFQVREVDAVDAIECAHGCYIAKMPSVCRVSNICFIGLNIRKTC